MPLFPQQQFLPAYYMKGVNASVTGTTSPTTLASLTLLGKKVGKAGLIAIWPLWGHTNSANNKTMQVQIGGTDFLNVTATAVSSLQRPIYIFCRDAFNSQSFMGVGQSIGLGNSTFGSGSATVDFSSNQTIDFIATLANSAETITLYGVFIEIWRINEGNDTEFGTIPIEFCDHTQHSVTGTTSPTSLKAFTLKGGRMGPNGGFLIDTLWSYTNNANSKICRVAFGGTNIVNVTVTTTATLHRRAIVFNLNNASSQAIFAASDADGIAQASITTFAQNTDNDVTVDCIGDPSNTGDTISLEAATAFVMREWDE